MNDILIVDGYNIIGAWGDLKKLRDVDLQSSRERLLIRWRIIKVIQVQK